MTGYGAGNPWSYLRSPDKSQQTVIGSTWTWNQIPLNKFILSILEPVLKSQYLTKLKRILPSYLDDLQDDAMAAALETVVLKENIWIFQLCFVLFILFYSLLPRK